VTLAAGQQYTEILDLRAVAPTASPRQSSSGATPLAASHPIPGDGAWQRGLPQWVFYTGVAATGLLTGVTVWSGIDTLNNKSDLPDRSAPDYVAATEQVESSATRTDWLLVATLVTAAATAAAGILWVDWDDRGTAIGLAPSTRGAMLKLRGRFQ
jgi:hypothetical protein